MLGIRVLILVLGFWSFSVSILAADKPAVAAVVKRLASGEPTRIVCFGDSITGAYYHTGGERAWCDMLGLALQRIYPQSHPEMINAGISGHTTANGLARMEKDVVAKQPHLVVVAFGMNDVARGSLDDYVANLTTIIRRSHEAGAAVVLCTPNTVYENSGRPIAKLSELSERVRKLAKEQNVVLADCFGETTALKERDQLLWMLSMSDEIHPNMNGHRQMAETVAMALTEKRVSLDHVPPPANSLHHTLQRLASGQPVHLVAMPPYDELMPAALRKHFPKADLKVTQWPVEGKSLAEIRKWAESIRGLSPDLVVPAIPLTATAESDGKFIDHYEWALNFSFPFAGKAWDVVPILPELPENRTQAQKRARELAREIIVGKDVRFVDLEWWDIGQVQPTPREMLSAWIDEQRQTLPSAWPELPAENGSVHIPAQEWPQRPGPRTVKVLVHYPAGKLENVKAETGIMLSLHNWGGEDCVGTADPQTLADKFNVVALCVNYLQSGKKDSIDGPEPYDCGYLQALDAIRAVWFVRTGLAAKKIPFAASRIYATGGSGGGNVSLMANKLAPRTFACIVDLCGMKKLSSDIAFNLPGGSDLNARWSRQLSSLKWLSPDEQDIRFVAHPEHLRGMRQLGNSCKTVVVHGVDDATCPFADAQELVANFQTTGLSIEPHFIAEKDLDGEVFTSSGHALGNRTKIVLQVAGKYLTPGSPDLCVRSGNSDFDLRDEQARYATTRGEFVISYAAGFPVGRFEFWPTPEYEEHQDLTYYLDRFGQRHKISRVEEWQVRRRHALSSLQAAMWLFPGESLRVPLDVKILEEKRDGKLIRRKLSFQSDPYDHVTAWLLIPAEAQGKKLPAVLCLHQTLAGGKDEPAGLAGSENLHYAKELAKRGYVTLSPDYPSFGEHPYEFNQPEFMSGSMKAVWDNIRAVDLLCTLPEVDPERIGVIGHSLGGHNALFTAPFEPRLKVIVSSCGFTSFLKDDMPSWTGPRYMPLIKTVFGNDAKKMPFDFTEVVASLAPRPFLAVAATKDNDFDVSGVRDVMKSAAPVYELLGKKSNLQASYPESPHDFPKEAREEAYKFLDRHLKQ
jgi:lysophospholipase L1-like esterase/cephalosporin-C deacetylase-like acetyl esterase